MPTHHDVGFELGHARNAAHVQHRGQAHLGVDRKGKANRAGGEQFGRLQASRAVALEVDACQACDVAGLEARLAQIAVHVGHGGAEEQQLALGLERHVVVGVVGSPVELRRRRDAQFGLGLVGIGGQVEAIGGADAEAKVPIPADVQAEAALDVQGEAWHIQ